MSKMCTGVDRLIIDEVSMVCSILLHSSGHPSFSGEMGVILGGDVVQLPPPVEPRFSGPRLQHDNLCIETADFLRNYLLTQTYTHKKVCYCLVHVVLLIIRISLVNFMLNVTK